ncbi:helix-turn-helix transcriptional regulator [Halalkalibacterium halodurans]|uniref:Transcriptional regulator n=2 Tax=Halalkalibacterium halodurans TaxID=86665 RepID=Q9KFL9_HALH5|nr:helix-turn-helix transcriptional regulator [Halalkalibacterium halodurans]MDY7220957.1 helix-turn-helix transcriptional regulator [Halalkalibacterium halodurans]MDY7240196.1 helix-turn-helix transcriptional regulator [Halalkalibacterium halodurans]MED3645415.1 helix-turn-helix transcriptional regulator [Halalkalibacterium halodurans]MED4083228.1 helix-turn-helix transcriptional regulator [Halalkalibacterium halodurans]MED4086602.1 helix-turn-helix transcriptional regulator [Halalkalibacteri
MKKKGKISNRINVLRAENSMTQKQLAERAGVTRQTIISIEKNKYVPSLALAFEIAHALNADIHEVFQYIQDEEE